MPRDATLADRLQGRQVGIVLSAGYFGFFGHVGFLQALEDHGIKAACYAGSSAGALVAALAAAGNSAEDILGRLRSVRRADFWDPDPIGAIASGLRGHAATGLLRGARLRALLDRNLPTRFEELAKPCAVVAANLTRQVAQVFTSGALAASVHASCAYPGLFRAAEVEGELFWDGGLVDKAPALALYRAFRPEVLLVHYLPSRSGGPPTGWGAYLKAMGGAVATLRRDHFRLQREVLGSLGVEVEAIENELPALSPWKLDRGAEVANLARRRVASSLARALAEREG